jgi:hypothetical protein
VLAVYPKIEGEPDMSDTKISLLIYAIKHGYGDKAHKAALRRELAALMAKD